MQKQFQLDGRNVEVWIPSSITAQTPVLVAHDGQNCFDGRYCIAGCGWELGQAAPAAAAKLGVLEPLIVAPWHLGDRRIMEYAPEDVLRKVDSWLAGYQAVAEVAYEPCGNAYIDWLVQRLLPWAKTEFGVTLDRNRTALIGSSMGGLVSLTALSKYPDVFECALCVSTHWTLGDMEFARACVEQLPPPGRHRLWFDHGDIGLEAGYQPLQDFVDGVLMQNGWEGHFVHRIYPGTDHSERDWSKRAEEIISYWLSGIPTSN